MNYAELISTADALAKKAHAGQVDKSGVDYINHPRTVASFVKEPKEIIVALLHDIIEDTDVTDKEIKQIFGAEICEAVVTMTHLENEDYFDYINRVKTNPLSTTVKIADLKHNMDLSRLTHITEKDLKRREKYQKALDILNAE